jgi:hypothetical protein
MKLMFGYAFWQSNHVCYVPAHPLTCYNQPVSMKKALESSFLRLVIGIFVALLTASIAIFALNLLSPPRPLAQLQPTRTATRRPPPTITPVAYPPTPPLVLQDDMATTEHFPNTEGVRLGYSYENGKYVLTPPLDPGFVRAIHQTFTDPDYLNLSLEATASPTENSGPVEYGVLFWHGEDEAGRERFLAFTISTDSTFRLLSYEPVQSDGSAFEITELIPKTSTETINLDGTPNKIRIDVHPRRMLAYVNDELVLDTDARVINEWRLGRDWDGRVGVIAFTMDAPGAEAQFEQFDIYADVRQQ